MSISDSKRSRRNFLGTMLMLVPAVSLPGLASLPALGPAPGKPYVPRYFTDDEWAFLLAACARLIPMDGNGPGAMELGVPEFIDREMDGTYGHAANWYMQGPFATAVPELGYQSQLVPRAVYRAGIAGVEAYCRANFGERSFSQLPSTTQDAVLTEMESGALVLAGVSSKTFFDFLLQNTKEGYLADPIHGGNRNMGSWKLIGFPGARADYADWVDRLGERYPIGPVGIAGGRG